ncbi:MAG TPA: DUF1631 family protein [Burkholderiaceae bacterium]|jgi:hypothetical protein
MNTPDTRLNPHLDAAIQRIRIAAEQAAERCAEGLGMAALSSGNIKKRDLLMSSQFIFRKQQAIFSQRFYQSLRTQIATESNAPAPAAQTTSSARKSGKQDWSELSLMDDEQVDALVAADRIGLALGHQSEWELREVETYVFGLSAGERNPLRPELVAGALLEGVNATTDDAPTREVLIDEMTRAMAQEMRGCYADIAELFRNRGLRPQDLRVRGADSHTTRNQSLQGGAPSMPGEFDPRGQRHSGHGGHTGHGGHGGHGGHSGYGGHGGPSGHGSQMGSYGGGRGGYPQGHGGGGGGFGMVDPQMMDLLRRLSHMPSPGYGGGGFAPSQPGGFEPSGFGEGQAVDWQNVPMPPNLIHLHRDELRQASTGRLDNMVIDVVGSLFDQILADAKVPPQMARLVARLQLPVLRVALGDNTFFSSRKHPVRRFVNRMASLACAYDDFSEDPGRAFLARVRELVQDVANGDFDHMEVYEAKLDELEAFIAEQTAAALKSQGDAAALIERKEVDLRLQQRYMQQLQAALGPVPMAPFLREFLSQVWSQAIVQASREGAPERELRLRQFGRDLVMSVQPKSGTAARQTFLGQLPMLMRTLNEGLDLIQWPEAARKTFFGDLLPAHAESLKGQGLSPLETNLLAKQLEQVFGCAPPSEKDLPASTGNTAPQDLDGPRLTAAEAKSLGLMDETGVDWDGKVDIELVVPVGENADVPLLSEEISLDGLPAVTEEAEPVSGELLIDHLQLGFAYQMNVGDEWKKMRLAHISAGRSFFIFTQGTKHQETVTMTARMLKRMCESGRLRSFENSYLLERATARARKQLAALNSQH